MKNLEFINLTPHKINLIGQDGNAITVAPSGTIARCSVKQEEVGELNEVTLYKSIYGEVENLPEPKEGNIYIVSSLVAGRVNRNDVVVPCKFLRDDEGNIIGAEGLTMV